MRTKADDCLVIVDIYKAFAYNISIKKHCDKRLALCKKLNNYLFNNRSLGRVAVVALYDYRNGVFTDM